MEYELPLPDGNRVFEASMVKCEGDKILAMVRDITERKEAQESLRKALAEVQQLRIDFMKRTFICRRRSESHETSGRLSAKVRPFNVPCKKQNK